MLVETLVLRGDESLKEDGTDGVVGYGRAVLVEELAQHFPVGTVDFGRSRRLGMDDVVDGR